MDIIQTDELQFMRVWHTNIEDPCTSRESVVLIPPKPQVQEEDMQVTVENFETTVSVVSTVPKRRRGNDSVSHI